MRDNPSEYCAANPPGGLEHPVEGVSWSECVQALLRYGLVLPTEAQWERGARAGSDASWWCGRNTELIGELGAGNVLDFKTSQTPGDTQDWGSSELWEDDFTVHAPVGSFAPNPFGLHDTIGNVSEWCLDLMASYDQPVRPGDGLRLMVKQSATQFRVYRDGSFSGTAGDARSAIRDADTSDFRDNTVGVRPACRVLQDEPE
jgi:formylglycine-generating enzyme required for sulfatase activity